VSFLVESNGAELGGWCSETIRSGYRYKAFRKLVVDLILSTDPTLHLQLVEVLSERVLVGNPFLLQHDSSGLILYFPQANDFNPSTRTDDRVLIMKFVMKTLALDYLAKMPTVREEWSKRLTQEDFNQGDMEKSLGIPVTPYMNRQSPQPNLVFKLSAEFLLKPSVQVLLDHAALERDLLPLRLKNLDNVWA